MRLAINELPSEVQKPKMYTGAVMRRVTIVLKPRVLTMVYLIESANYFLVRYSRLGLNYSPERNKSMSEMTTGISESEPKPMPLGL